MLNYIWFGMMAIGVGAGIYNGRIDAVTNAAIDMAKVSVEISIGLIGIMALWLGIMKIAEESGLIRIIAKGLRPITVRLFPDVPEDHPAIGSIVLNMSANILGLGNAATPLGLKAMEELQELNDQKDTATNSMVMFLAINTSSVQTHSASDRRRTDGRRRQRDFCHDDTRNPVLDRRRDRGREIPRETKTLCR